MRGIASIDRSRLLKSAVLIESVSLAWNVIEATVGMVASAWSGSLSIQAFSIDSAIELLSGTVVLLRLLAEPRYGRGTVERLERISSAVVAVCLFSLCGYIAFESGQSLARHHMPSQSTLGLALAALSSFITPWLAVRKRRLGSLLDSPALIGDAACSFTCAYMAWTLLAGILLAHLLGWWWVDPVCAIGILYFVSDEAWESAHAAWTGEAHDHGHHHHHALSIGPGKVAVSGTDSSQIDDNPIHDHNHTDDHNHGTHIHNHSVK